MAIESDYGYFPYEQIVEWLQKISLHSQWLEAGRMLLTLRRRFAFRKGKLEEIIDQLNWKGRTARYLMEIAERLDREEREPPAGISYRKLGEIINLNLPLSEIFSHAQRMSLDDLKEMRKEHEFAKRLKKEWEPPWEFQPTAQDD